MGDFSTIDHLVDAMVGLPVDVSELVLDALHDSLIDLSAQGHDDVVKILSAAVSAAAGVTAKHYLEQHEKELRAAIQRGLAGP